MLQETQPLAESSSLQGQGIISAWVLEPSQELLTVQYFRQYIQCFYKLFSDGTAPDLTMTISVSLNVPPHLHQNKTAKQIRTHCLPLLSYNPSLNLYSCYYQHHIGAEVRAPQVSNQVWLSRMSSLSPKNCS